MNYDNTVVKSVWEKAQIVMDFNPDRVRRDVYGLLISWDEYNNPNSPLGWKVEELEESQELLPLQIENPERWFSQDL